MISSIRCLFANHNLFGIRSIERTLTYISKFYFLNKIAAASAIKGCPFAGVSIVQ